MSTVNYELIVLEAISEPDVHKACTVDGRAVLTCSVKRGDKVRFQWMLHPNSSEGTAPLLGHIQYFDRQTPGYLICETENEISRKKSAPVTMKCRGTAQFHISQKLFQGSLSLLFTWYRNRSSRSTPVLKACTNPETRADSQNDVALQCSDVKENIYVEMHGDLGKKDKDGKAFTAVLDIFHSDACNTVSSATYRNTTENIEDMENVYV
ncbi:T-cell surface antigen CD2-like isoform X3 [Arapaima gigas]